jgi:hypothetical protein
VSAQSQSEAKSLFARGANNPKMRYCPEMGWRLVLAVLAMSGCNGTGTPPEENMSQTYELHFREGFGGDHVTILVDGKPVKQLDLTTRMQLGLAHIEKVELKPKQKLSIQLKDHADLSNIPLNKKSPYIKIDKEEDAVAIEPTDVSPGYL